MVKFLDGPAAGVVLDLRRAPVLLRVVRDRAGNWDALDQIDDTPKPSEAIHVYRLEGEATTYHLLIRGKGKRASGFRAMAQYRHHPERPTDEEMRSTELWQAWCASVKDRDEKGLLIFRDGEVHIDHPDAAAAVEAFGELFGPTDAEAGEAPDTRKEA